MSELLQGVLDNLPDQVLPAPDSISYYVLEKERIIYLDFDVSTEVLTIHRMILKTKVSLLKNVSLLRSTLCLMAAMSTACGC